MTEKVPVEDRGKDFQRMKLDYQIVDLELALPWATSRTILPGGLRSSAVVHVTLRDEDGLVGFGEAAPISRYRESAETACEFLSQLDATALSTERLGESLERIANAGSGQMAARCAAEMALLDLAGKRRGRPVFELLKLEPPKPRPVSYTIGIGSADHVREQVRRAEGFQILKLKLGGPNDREALQALRDVAPDKRVRVDANEGWSNREQALRMIEWLADDSLIEFVEQPLPAKLPDEDHRWLHERSPLPLFADESCHRSREVSRLVGLFHGVNVKLMKTGGLTEAVATLKEARRLGMQTMIGCMIESTLGIAAAFHLGSLADHLDLDSHGLLAWDPFAGLVLDHGILNFAWPDQVTGLGVIQKEVKPVTRPTVNK